MADGNFQTDFFEGKFYERKGRKPQFLNKYSAQRILPYLRVPVEYTVILGIVILVLLVISYAVGVEKGKRVSSAKKIHAQDDKSQVIENNKLTKTIQAEKFPEDLRQDTNDRDKDPESLDIEEKAAPIPSVIETEAKEEEERETSADKALYTIRLASFKKEGDAKREVARLKKTGKDASYARKGLWYQVFVKGYETIETARKAKDALIQEYPDCYIRKEM